MPRVPRTAPPRTRSGEAARLYSDLMAVEPAVRRQFMAGLTRDEIEQVLIAAALEAGTPYALWGDDPVGFVEDVLGETLWSLPKRIMQTVATTKRVAVPSCFGSSKSWSAARLALWKALTSPVGTTKVVTIAPRWSHVYRQLWPEIRKAHAAAGLPGRVDMAQLKLRSKDGIDTVVAYGQAVQPWDEAAIQGIHAPRLMLIVDEAGGIGHIIGRNLRGMLVGDSSTHMLAIGNPPTDDEGSWFESLCGSQDVTVVPISAYATPNLSGEQAPRCQSCPAEMPPHTLAAHLVDQDWVDEAIRDNGDDSNYVQAKVYARFPKGGPDRAIPSMWLEAAADPLGEPDPDDDTGAGWIRLCDLGLPSETLPWLVRPGAWVRLGVDVAADGGDELVISACIGNLAVVWHTSSGAANANAVDVAGVVLEAIRRAERIRGKLGTEAKVRVKIDGIGVGWGVCGVLDAWGSEGLHDAEIVPVIVSEDTYRPQPESATLRPYRKRDEMWLAGRALMQPVRTAPAGMIRLRVDSKCLAQLRAPTKGTTMTGHTRIESKKSMKKRGLASPDRAEAVLLGLYEPVLKKKKKPARLIA